MANKKKCPHCGDVQGTWDTCGTCHGERRMCPECCLCLVCDQDEEEDEGRRVYATLADAFQRMKDAGTELVAKIEAGVKGEPIVCPECGDRNMYERVLWSEFRCFAGGGCNHVLPTRDELDAATKAKVEARDPYGSLDAMSLYQVDDPCDVCGGLGRRGYPTTSTWRGGPGGNMITGDVCDKCWGSGDRHRPWKSHRELDAEWRELRKAKAMLDELDAPDAEAGDPKPLSFQVCVEYIPRHATEQIYRPLVHHECEAGHVREALWQMIRHLEVDVDEEGDDDAER